MGPISHQRAAAIGAIAVAVSLAIGWLLWPAGGGQHSGDPAGERPPPSVQPRPQAAPSEPDVVPGGPDPSLSPAAEAGVASAGPPPEPARFYLKLRVIGSKEFRKLLPTAPWKSVRLFSRRVDGGETDLWREVRVELDTRREYSPFGVIAGIYTGRDLPGSYEWRVEVPGAVPARGDADLAPGPPVDVWVDVKPTGASVELQLVSATGEPIPRGQLLAFSRGVWLSPSGGVSPEVRVSRATRSRLASRAHQVIPVARGVTSQRLSVPAGKSPPSSLQLLYLPDDPWPSFLESPLGVGVFAAGVVPADAWQSDTVRRVEIQGLPAIGEPPKVLAPAGVKISAIRRRFADHWSPADTEGSIGIAWVKDARGNRGITRVFQGVAGEDSLRVERPNWRTVSGRITNREGAPVEGARIGVSQPVGDLSFGILASTDADGRYELTYADLWPPIVKIHKRAKGVIQVQLPSAAVARNVDAVLPIPE